MLNFKYTSAKPSPLPPRAVQAGFKPAATPAAAIAAGRVYVQNNRNEPVATSLKNATRTFSSNLLLFNSNQAPEQAPRLATHYMTGGKGDGSVLTRERTMDLYERHKYAFDD